MHSFGSVIRAARSIRVLAVCTAACMVFCNNLRFDLMICEWNVLSWSLRFQLAVDRSRKAFHQERGGKTLVPKLSTARGNFAAGSGTRGVTVAFVCLPSHKKKTA